MSSKVIKWFKRQASIRRFTEKTEDKVTATKSSSGEKKKNPFSRINSFRKKKKKTDPLEETGLPNVGISKRYSYSVPEEIESGAKDQTTSIAHNSVSLEKSMSIPSRIESPSKSSVSELSYQSSFDNEAHSSEFSRSFSPSDDTELEKAPLDSDTITSPTKSLHTDPANGDTSSRPVTTCSDTKPLTNGCRYEHPQENAEGNVIPIIIINHPSPIIRKPPLAAVESYSSDDLSCLSDLEETEMQNSANCSKENVAEMDKLTEKTKNLKIEDKSCDLDNSVNTGSEVALSCDKIVSQSSVTNAHASNSKGDVIVCEMLENTELVIYESDEENCSPTHKYKTPVVVSVSTTNEIEDDTISYEKNTNSLHCELTQKSQTTSIVHEPSQIDVKNRAIVHEPGQLDVQNPPIVHETSQNILIETEPSQIDPGQIQKDTRNSSIVIEQNKNSSLISEQSQNYPIVPEQSQNYPIVSEQSQNYPIVPEQSQNYSIVPEQSQNSPIVPDQSQNDSQSSSIVVEVNQKETRKSHVEPEICSRNIQNSSIVLQIEEKESELSDSKSILTPNLLNLIQEAMNDSTTDDSDEDDKATVVDLSLIHHEDDIVNATRSDNLEQENCNYEINDVGNSSNVTEEFENNEITSKIITAENDIEKIKSDDKQDIIIDDADNNENVLTTDSKILESESEIEYPDELNPFDSDDKDVCKNKKAIVSPKIYNDMNKENGHNPFGSDTEIEAEYKKLVGNSRSKTKPCNDFCRVSENTKDISSHRVSPQTHPRKKNHVNETNKENKIKPYIDSGEQESSLDPRPNLPAKVSTESRKNSSGSLTPVPRPRKIKLHGSTTSLQNNVSTQPIPAPRSVTPYGSARNLTDIATNPFADDMDDEDDNSSAAFDNSSAAFDNSSAVFDRRGCGRNTLQGTSQSPFVRADIGRGSLPSSPKGRRKKRPAPSPPTSGLTNKPPKAAANALPRKRSTSPSAEPNVSKTSQSKLFRPIRPAPPRPPPPKI